MFAHFIVCGYRQSLCYGILETAKIALGVNFAFNICFLLLILSGELSWNSGREFDGHELGVIMTQ